MINYPIVMMKKTEKVTWEISLKNYLIMRNSF